MIESTQVLERQSNAGTDRPVGRLIWLSHFIPFPPRGGAHQRSYNLLREASKQHEITLVAFNRPVVDREHLRTYAQELDRFCRHVEFWELPFPWKGVRWWAGLATNALDALPHSCEVYRSPDLLRRWEALLERAPDAAVHLDSSDLAAFAPASAGRRVLLNHHNCESAMAARRANVESNPVKKFFLAAQARRHAHLERDLCATVSVNAVVSSEDRDSLRLNSPAAHIHVVPNGTDTAYFVPNLSRVRPNTLVFAGSLTWYPNISGLRLFRTRLWPRLTAAAPGIRFIVAGKNPAPEIVAWAASDTSIELVDSPPDIRPSLDQGAVFVCPIIDGGGTRLKLLDAMSAGKAIVTTKIGAEGLGLEHGCHAMIAESDEEFVELTLTLLRNPGLRATLGTRARDFVERNFAWEEIGRELEAAYSCLGSEMSESRRAAGSRVE